MAQTLKVAKYLKTINLSGNKINTRVAQNKLKNSLAIKKIEVVF